MRSTSSFLLSTVNFLLSCPPEVYYGRRPAGSMRTVIFVAALLMEMTTAASAQHHSGEPFVAVRGGTNLVGNTYRVRDTKPEPGAGASFGTFLSPYWAIELETWMRRGNPECCGPKRREMLYSLSVIRHLTAGGLQPYMIGGVTFLQAASSELQVQVGVGAQFPVYRHFSMSIDLRGNGGGSTMIVRPTAAIIYYFR